MHRAKLVSLTSCLRPTAALALLLCGLIVMPALATDQEPRELVPGLDLWSHEREMPPQSYPKGTAQDLLSRVERHRAYLEGGVPIEYRSRKSPYPAATEAIDGGGRLYQSHCIACHGSNGRGDGEAGRDLTPLPALLAYMVKRPRAVDEYLLWTISEGGARFGTEMPAFKEALTEHQIWQIVSYMRGGFPLIGAAEQE